MEFPYRRLAEGLSRPIIPITIRNPQTDASLRYFALVDSSADMCVLPGEIAELIGLDLATGKRFSVSGGVAGETRPYYVHEVEIDVGGRRRLATVGFMPDLSANGYGLLSQAGFFDRFEFVTFSHPQGSIVLGDEV